jgi:Spy/CpxP family protein refolding chaperone
MIRIGKPAFGLLLLLLAWPAAAQDPPAFMRELYPPELIMRYGRDLGLTEAQRKSVTRAVAETQTRTLELQWQLQEAARTLAERLAPDRVDEEAALEAAARVMQLEGRIKRAHLGLLVRIKNQLLPEQQRRLDALRGP